MSWSRPGLSGRRSSLSGSMHCGPTALDLIDFRSDTLVSARALAAIPESRAEVSPGGQMTKRATAPSDPMPMDAAVGGLARTTNTERRLSVLAWPPDIELALQLKVQAWTRRSLPRRSQPMHSGFSLSNRDFPPPDMR